MADNEMQLIAQLTNDFHFGHIVETQNGISVLYLSGTWRGTSGVKHIHVSLSGKHPLSGEEIQSDVHSLDIFPGGNEPIRYQLNSPTCGGEYRIVFTAILSNGKRLEDCLRDQPVYLPGRNSPYIKYKRSTPRGFFTHNFTEITIKSNCWPRCHDKLWLVIDEKYLPIPVEQVKLINGTYAEWSWRLAADSAAVIRLIAASELPSPVEDEQL